MTSCYPVRDQSGRVAAVGAMTLDVTDHEHGRRRAEHLLRFAGLVGAVTSDEALARRMVEFVSSTFRARCAVARDDHYRLMQHLAPKLSEWSRDHVDAAAGRKGNDELHRPLRPSGLRAHRYACDKRDDDERYALEHRHAH